MRLLRRMLLLFVAVGIGTPITAQQTAENQRGSEAQESLRPGTKVRVSQNGVRVEGELVGADLPTLIRVTTRAGVVSQFQLSAIDSLWVQRTRTRRGAFIGLVIGMIPVAVICGDTLDECGLVPNGLAVVGFGALAGAAIGDLFRSWKRILP